MVGKLKIEALEELKEAALSGRSWEDFKECARLYTLKSRKIIVGPTGVKTGGA